MKNLAKILVSSLLAMTVVSSSALAETTTDKENPGNVEGLTLTAMDKGAKVSWSPATDNVGIKGYVVHYGLESVDESGEKYDFNKDVGNVTEASIGELENGTRYYFSVIAYDAAGLESLKWAKEQSVVPSSDAPEAGAEDKDAPQVSSATASNNETVKVVFSEAVVLPSDAAGSFSIQNESSLQELTVSAAVLDATDTSKKTVILTTAKQEADANYKITVGVNVKDPAGNAIVSGTSDTAAFKGSAQDKPAGDTSGPKVQKVEVLANDKILVTFDETIILGIDPANNFTIVSAEDATKTLTVLGVELGNSDSGVEDAAAIITTAPQEAISYKLTVSGITDEGGNSVDSTAATMEFKAGSPGTIEEPTIPNPEDVADFMAEKFFSAGSYMVKLSWKLPNDHAENILEQVLYMSQDKGENYTKKATLNPDVTEYEISGLSEGEYWFKLTQKDEAGKETDGVVAKLVLPATGPGAVGALLFSIGVGTFLSNRRKK